MLKLLMWLNSVWTRQCLVGVWRHSLPCFIMLFALKKPAAGWWIPHARCEELLHQWSGECVVEWQTATDFSHRNAKSDRSSRRFARWRQRGWCVRCRRDFQLFAVGFQNLGAQCPLLSQLMTITVVSSSELQFLNFDSRHNQITDEATTSRLIFVHFSVLQKGPCWNWCCCGSAAKVSCVCSSVCLDYQVMLSVATESTLTGFSIQMWSYWVSQKNSNFINNYLQSKVKWNRFSWTS